MSQYSTQGTSAETEETVSYDLCAACLPQEVSDGIHVFDTSASGNRPSASSREGDLWSIEASSELVVGGIHSGNRLSADGREADPWPDVARDERVDAGNHSGNRPSAVSRRCDPWLIGAGNVKGGSSGGRLEQTAVVPLARRRTGSTTT